MAQTNEDTTLEDIVHNYWQNQPHPQEPRLTVGDYPTAMKMAATLGFGTQEPSPQAAANLWAEFTEMNNTLVNIDRQPISPEEFMHVAQQAATSSFAYHNRPPSMHELQRFRDAHPKDIVGYYAAMPDQNYPHVSAGDMAKSMTVANWWSQQHLGRPANKGEAAYLHHSGEDPQSFYERLGAEEKQG